MPTRTDCFPRVPALSTQGKAAPAGCALRGFDENTLAGEPDSKLLARLWELPAEIRHTRSTMHRGIIDHREIPESVVRGSHD